MSVSELPPEAQNVDRRIESCTNAEKAKESLEEFRYEQQREQASKERLHETRQKLEQPQGTGDSKGYIERRAEEALEKHDEIIKPTPELTNGSTLVTDPLDESTIRAHYPNSIGNAALTHRLGDVEVDNGTFGLAEYMSSLLEEWLLDEEYDQAYLVENYAPRDLILIHNRVLQGGNLDKR